MKSLKVWLLASMLLVIGCGSSGGGASVDTGGGGGSQPPQTGTLVVRQEILARAVASEIQSVRISGFGNIGEAGDAYAPMGSPVYGPVVLPKSTVYTLSDVPVGVKEIRLEYLQNGSVRGIHTQAVTINPAAPFEIVDPDYVDLAGAFTRIEVSGFSFGTPDLERQRFTVIPGNQFSPYDLRVTAFADGGGDGIDITHLVALTSDNPQVLDVTRSVYGYFEYEYGQAGLANVSASFIDLEDSLEVEVLNLPGPHLQQITFLQQNGQLTVGESTQLVAIGQFTDGSTRNLTSSLVWSERPYTEGMPLLQFDPNTPGLVTPTAAGPTQVWMEYAPQRFKAAGYIYVNPAP